MLSGRVSGAGASAPLTGINYVGSYTSGVIPSTTDITVMFGGSLTGGLASSASEGDLVIVYFAVGTSFRTEARDLQISGYTQLQRLFADDSNETTLLVAYKFMGSSPDSSFTIVGGTRGTVDAGAVVVQVWRGVDPTTPFSPTETTAIGFNSALCDPPPITPSVAGSYIVAGGSAGHTRGTTVPPARFTSSDLSDFRSIVGPNTTNDVTIGVGYFEWSSGTFNPGFFTFNGANSTSFCWAAVTLALLPAP